MTSGTRWTKLEGDRSPIPREVLRRFPTAHASRVLKYWHPEHGWSGIGPQSLRPKLRTLLRDELGCPKVRLELRDEWGVTVPGAEDLEVTL